MTYLMRLFFQGLLLLLPAVLTIYLVFLIFTALNETLFYAVGALTGRLFPGVESGWLVTLTGIGVTFAVIILTGLVASNYLGKFLLGRIDALLDRIPLVKMLYSSLKDLFGAFLGDKKRFDTPVLVSVTPDDSVRLMGFVTQASMADFGLENDVAVYLPQSYNFAGNLIVVPKDRIQRLDVPAATVTAFLLSGGVSNSRS
ncbi:DUF502 domain-containing protein [Marinobacterium rhizophilum]|uniref:DUF502 domain-containing protein n=1 Tax=Marinobacterium rhizophilum TaxID=420402 RepID=A0ABY5HHM6_9GAMM|nr:DUF502 domain-containing protein [Marinobacterium rhizophilum]UTW11351.1 DUF502 domain-containing protein [Marinobacterium rhizophilum]